MEQYIKKPINITAVQWDGTEESAINIASLDDFKGCIDFKTGDFNGFYIDTLEGRMHVSPGDYVIRGIRGEYYPCKPDIFEESYIRVYTYTEPEE